MKVKYVGAVSIELWDGRIAQPGDVVDVTDEQAAELVARGEWTEVVSDLTVEED